MRFDYVGVLVFLVLAFLFMFVSLTAQKIVSRWVRSYRPDPEKLSAYECGEEAVGPSWIRFNIRFYVMALVFIVFDVEVVLLFPWARVYQELFTWYRSVVFWDMVVFVGILSLGLAYVWAKGDLEWTKSFRKHLSPAEKLARPQARKEAP